MGQEIFVHNHNDFDHVDHWDGYEFVFPKGEKTVIPQEAAVHMFGFGLADKSETLVRLGWAARFDEAKRVFVEDPEGVRKLQNFTFSRSKVVEAEVPVEAVEPEVDNNPIPKTIRDATRPSKHLQV